VNSETDRARHLLTEREFEAWELKTAGLKQADIARRMRVSAARIVHLLHSANAKLGNPVATRAKQRGYKTAAERDAAAAKARAERERGQNEWILDRFDNLSEAEQEIVDESLCRALSLSRLPKDEWMEFLKTGGTIDWARSNLSPEAFAFLRRAGAATDDQAHDPEPEGSVSWRNILEDLLIVAYDEESHHVSFVDEKQGLRSGLEHVAKDDPWG
jgi:DNA-binding CsgD family transcriptional regulator